MILENIYQEVIRQKHELTFLFLKYFHKMLNSILDIEFSSSTYKICQKHAVSIAENR